MTSMGDEYRRRAKACFDAAHATETQQTRAALLRLAEEWLRMAGSWDDPHATPAAGQASPIFQQQQHARARHWQSLYVCALCQISEESQREGRRESLPAATWQRGARASSDEYAVWIVARRVSASRARATLSHMAQAWLRAADNCQDAKKVRPAMQQQQQIQPKDDGNKD